MKFAHDSGPLKVQLKIAENFSKSVVMFKILRRGSVLQALYFYFASLQELRIFRPRLTQSIVLPFNLIQVKKKAHGREHGTDWPKAEGEREKQRKKRERVCV